MKLGFSILSHKKPDLIFKQLLLKLNCFSNKVIAIHHDFNQAPFNNELLINESIQVVKEYVRTYWSHTNNIKAIMDTFKLLYEANCDWYITLSANCYPIKPASYIQNFLSDTNYDGFVNMHSIWTDKLEYFKYFRKAFSTKYMFRVPYLNRDLGLKYRSFRISRAPEDVLFTETFIPYHGSDWFIINKKSMKYLLDNEKTINSMVAFFKKINSGPDLNVCPPEVIFQSILGNSDLHLSNNYYRFIDWINSTNFHPNTLTLKHWKYIQNSDALFARKFDSQQSRELIDLINNEILNQ